jgi:hypothetical protein
MLQHGTSVRRSRLMPSAVRRAGAPPDASARRSVSAPPVLDHTRPVGPTLRRATSPASWSDASRGELASASRSDTSRGNQPSPVGPTPPGNQPPPVGRTPPEGTPAAPAVRRRGRNDLATRLSKASRLASKLDPVYGRNQPRRPSDAPGKPVGPTPPWKSQRPGPSAYVGRAGRLPPARPTYPEFTRAYRPAPRPSPGILAIAPGLPRPSPGFLGHAPGPLGHAPGPLGHPWLSAGSSAIDLCPPRPPRAHGPPAPRPPSAPRPTSPEPPRAHLGHLGPPRPLPRAHPDPLRPGPSHPLPRARQR